MAPRVDAPAIGTELCGGHDPSARLPASVRDEPHRVDHGHALDGWDRLPRRIQPIAVALQGHTRGRTELSGPCQPAGDGVRDPAQRLHPRVESPRHVCRGRPGISSSVRPLAVYILYGYLE